MEPHCLQHDVPWSLDICSTQRSPIHQVQTQGASNRDTHLYPPHNISVLHLTTTYVRRTGRVINGMQSWRTTHNTPYFHPRHRHPPTRNDPPKKILGSGLTASAPVSDISAPACTNGVRPLFAACEWAQKDKRSTVWFSYVPKVDVVNSWFAHRTNKTVAEEKRAVSLESS